VAAFSGWLHPVGGFYYGSRDLSDWQLAGAGRIVMDWQIVIVAVVVIASAIALFRHFHKTVKKPESACDSCSMKDQCGIGSSENKSRP
jgi:hypothetical protein